ncbi:MAG: DUF4292 domain-containing protein [Chitinophagaceae bacterium]|nr:DUF4292 domain-containing protein [Chitinophagaceae bacterium]
MKRIYVLAVTIVLLLAFSACRSTKKIQQAIVKKDTVVTVLTVVQPTHEDTMRMVNDLLLKVQKNRIEFNTFSAKIRVDYTNSKGKQPDFIANIRMLKDSLIWISLSNDIGIEGIRVLITKDSIKIMDKLANTYQVRPLEHIQEVSQIPFAFSDLQNLLLGNPLFFNKDSIISYSQAANGYALLSIDPQFKNRLSIGNGFLVEKSKLDDNDPVMNRTCDLIYNDYENKAGVMFSAYREISIIQQNKLEVQLKFKDYKFNEQLSFPFTIPKKFKRI